MKHKLSHPIPIFYGWQHSQKVQSSFSVTTSKNMVQPQPGTCVPHMYFRCITSTTSIWKGHNLTNTVQGRLDVDHSKEKIEDQLIKLQRELNETKQSRQ